MEDQCPLALAVSFDHRMDNRPVSDDELELIAAFLPELLKEMLLDEETEEQ